MEAVYERRVNYYETDRMGVVHHASYIKYFEEARIYFIDKLGFSYKEMEGLGIIMPVLSIECKYKTSADFDDILMIKTYLESIGTSKAAFSYRVINKKTGGEVCKGSSSHGFLNKSFSPVNIKKQCPHIYEALLSAVGKQT